VIYRETSNGSRPSGASGAPGEARSSRPSAATAATAAARREVSAVHLNEFPARIETPTQTWVDYRLLVEPGVDAGTWRARIFAKDGQQRADLEDVVRVDPLGNRTWAILSPSGSWRVQRKSGCGCGGGKVTETAPATVAELAQLDARLA
jgi:hypothetical protein